VDARREVIAVREASKLGVPIIAITDTNADPELIDYPVPGNDDAIRSVALITKALCDTIEIARREVPEDDRRRVDELEATTYSTETGETTEKERPQRRRPRRRRRPKPEVIAQHLRDGEGEDDLGDGDDAADDSGDEESSEG
jgi:small subunit ribosomal protein S2